MPPLTTSPRRRWRSARFLRSAPRFLGLSAAEDGTASTDSAASDKTIDEWWRIFIRIVNTIRYQVNSSGKAEHWQTGLCRVDDKERRREKGAVEHTFHDDALKNPRSRRGNTRRLAVGRGRLGTSPSDKAEEGSAPSSSANGQR
ncbi:hypothetical protein THAOC_12105 [Thalassiosira oceanica]|uniref:Uncharacterized protein n=1 Tax=Thalassiosira oceanica TaxID=159749 RepID=K0T8R6_THAOC|nr:hypothetical protein THAOC_12105 [Thalassiosira oceanica]|eukprot:EJK66922.1 hypothetical protein THAOC_12105 [Thalassiosira oceanica]